MELDLVYSQSSGALWLADSKNGRAFVAYGYSGKGSGQNQPGSEAIRSHGPIPGGMWRIGVAIVHPTLGQAAIPLSPVGHSAHGRSGFYIHGDNRKADRSASSGCIILPWNVRQCIIACCCRALEVIP